MHLHQLQYLPIFKTNHHTPTSICYLLIQRWNNSTYLVGWSNFITSTKDHLINQFLYHIKNLLNLEQHPQFVANPLWPSVGLKPNTPKVGELESSGTPERLEFNSKAQNTSHWGVLTVIGKVLKRRYRKCPRIGHLDICNPSYGQKKGRESNWQFDSRPLKVRNRPLPDIRIESAIRRWKDLDEGYKCGLDLVAIKLCSRELWAPKVPGLQPGQFRDNFGTISGLQLGSPGKKSHLDVVPVGCRREYYMGEGGGFPRVRAVVSLVVQNARGLSQHPRVFPNVN